MIFNLFLQLLLSLTLLLLSGQVLVRTSLKLSRLLHLSAFFIGTIIMGFASSLPELSVALQGAFAGSSEITLGNVLGSNIANTLLILGLSSVLRPMPAGILDKKSAYWNIAAHIFLLGCFLFNVLSWPQGLCLLLTFAFYLKFIGASAEESHSVLSEKNQVNKDMSQVFFHLMILIASLALLIYSAELLVQGAIKIATALGVSEKVIAVTIVAIGTSLPEIVMAIMAAWHQKPELVFSTVLGSNVFNILLIVGLTSLLCPMAIPSNLYPDLFLACICSLLLISGVGLTRAVGFFMLSIYASYIMLMTM